MGILDTFKRKPAASATKKKVAAKKAVAKPATEKTVTADGSKKVLAVSGVLLQPVYTEKSLRLQAQNQYVFIVAQGTNKHQVMMAVKDTYGVEPVSVRVVRIQPQTMYRWGRATGMRKAVKKAIVHMPAGTTLPTLQS